MQMQRIQPNRFFQPHNSMPYRNMLCDQYNTCLSRAAIYDKRDLGCSVCQNMDMATKKEDAFDAVKEVRKEIVNQREAAIYLGISRDRLRELEKAGNGPVSTLNPSGKQEYKISVLRAFLRSEMPDAEIVTAPAAATFLGISSRSLRTLRDNGSGPPHIRAGKYYQYVIADIRAYKVTKIKP